MNVNENLRNPESSDIANLAAAILRLNDSVSIRKADRTMCGPLAGCG